MYTQCPDCLTVYKLEAELLVPACGCLRCSHCDAVFNALGTLAAHLPPEPFTRLPEHALDRDPPVADVAVFRPRSPAAGPDPAVEPVDEADAAMPAPDDFSQLTFTPKFARTKKQRSWRTAGWITVCLVLLLGLGAQLAWAKRDTLVGDPTFGPILSTTCNVIGCQLPLVAAPAQLRLLARDVEQHPSVQDGLLITASVHNDASFAQPYPVVTIVLSDADGQRLAMRRFQPEDYVGDASLRAHGLAGGATTAMVFEVQDPGQRAVAFAFSFE
ncbi:zinc-ribbon domain-containing protein [Bacillus sp. NP157]|nr:zinc-ribbon domain-containing protein [Bacillus sp. NP157]